MSIAPRPTVLIVLDGWGHSDTPEHNAIMAAHTPNWDRLWQQAPHTLVSGSGLDVGLPEGQMGNSEVGHMNLGAGRVVYQEFTRIGRAIEDGTFQTNPALCGAVDAALAGDSALHVFGLLSPGGVHSHEVQIQAMVRLAAARGLQRVYMHAFLDGRDTPPRSAAPSIESMEATLRECGCPPVASICGRYYAMDRDQRWERVERAWRMLVHGEAGYHATDARSALEQAYARDESDEFVQPTCIHGEDRAPVRVQDGDAIVFMNFRADRARQLTRAFTQPDFDGFQRGPRPALSRFVTLTRYADDIDADVAFAPVELKNTLGEYVAAQGLRQLRIAETEKYAHVTFFFSGGREAPYEGEERILVPSPKVATYDLQPEMSARQVTDELIKAIQGSRFDLIVCNYANGDMVGHTGVFAAAVQACEVIDECLGRVTSALDQVGGQCLITADHGNVEQMRDVTTGQAHTAHTCEPVPLVYSGPLPVKLSDGGTLSDIAPTVLELMRLPQPAEMTGHSLLAASAGQADRRAS